MKITKRQLKRIIQEYNQPELSPWDSIYDDLEMFIQGMASGDADFDNDAVENVRSQLHTMIDTILDEQVGSQQYR